MVLGTGSHVGKSLVAAGLCRILSDRGLKVAPFKAQNMALNSVVASDGAEIGQAQALQALAARVPAVAAMNPVLLKPVRGQGSQVILLGQAQGFMTTAQYFKFWPKAAKTAEAAWKSLAAAHQALVMEGAGSPAEVNLAHRDLANLATGRFSRAPWILVVDIERGGSFAAIVGTLGLIPAWLRKRCLGVVFNKFRGDVGLMEPGLRWLKRRGIRPLGVLPYLDGLALEQEDSLGLPSALASACRVRRTFRYRLSSIRRSPTSTTACPWNSARASTCSGSSQASNGRGRTWSSCQAARTRWPTWRPSGPAVRRLSCKPGRPRAPGCWASAVACRCWGPGVDRSGRATTAAASAKVAMAGLGLLDVETRMARDKGPGSAQQARCSSPLGRLGLARL